MQFLPNFEKLQVQAVRGCYSVEEMEPEQGVYSATPEFVREHCGPIANSILDRIPEWYFEEAKDRGLYPNIDVRVHRLYPGNIPAYPGLHCDGNVRETYFAQPDLLNTPVSRHIICSVSTHPEGVSNTEFVTVPCEVELPQDPNKHPGIWAMVHEKTKHLPRTTIPDGDLILFDSLALHCATPAKFRGWRLFFRMAMWYRPNLGRGKLSRQEMIYVSSDNFGW